MPATLEELAFDLSRAAIDQQERRQAELRSRAATVLAAASIAGSFLASQAIKGDHHGALVVVAVASYLGCVAAAIYALLPHELVLEFRGSVALEMAADANAELPATLAAVTQWLEHFHEQNGDTLQRIGAAYALACGFLGAEIVLWTASYAGKLV